MDFLFVTARLSGVIPENGHMRTCTCGHDEAAHEHYREGTECSLCACAGFTRPWRDVLRRVVSWLSRLLR
jgi:hypothetical protein